MNTFRKRLFAAIAAIPITFAPYLANSAETAKPASQKSLSTIWKASEAREVIDHRPSRGERGAIYNKYVDAVFAELDKDIANVKTLGDLLNAAQKAFKAADQQHGQEVRRIPAMKIEPLLSLERYGAKNSPVFLKAGDAVATNPKVAELLADENGSSLSVSVYFMPKSGNFLMQYIVGDLGENGPISQNEKLETLQKQGIGQKLFIQQGPVNQYISEP